MKISSLCLAVLSLALVPAVAAEALTIGYGTEKSQVGFTNQISNPNQEDLEPWGPRSFRVHNGEFWVADTVGGRVLHLAADGKLLHEVSVGTPGALIEDIALKTDAAGAVEGVLLIRADTQEVVLLGLDGKLQKTFGGQGAEFGKFIQAALVETSASGNVVVADFGRQILCVFAPDGSVLREMPWGWSGFALDQSGNLARLQWDEAAKIGHLIIESPDGKSINDIGLQIEEHTNPKLWWVGARGESLVTYIPAAGFKGEYAWAMCDAAGKITSSGRVKPPVVMNRFLAQDSDATWYLGAADYNKAPKGNLTIEKYEFK